MKSFADLANPWVKGLGVYEPGRPIEEVARELGFASADDVIKLASNENSLGPSPKAVAAMCAAAGDMHRYPDGSAFYLKEALARALHVKPEQILPGNGSNEILELMAHAFLDQGTSIVMADRAFVVYKLVAFGARARVITVPMRDFTHDLDAMAAAVQADTRIVFISNPNNPTSTMVGRAEIERFMGRVSPDVIVCFDEAYIELLPEDQAPDTLAYVREGRNVIVVRTFSKVFGLAGLRLGYAVAPEPCMALLHRVRQPFNVNAMALSAGIAALDDAEHVAKTRRLVAEGLAYLEAEMKRHKIAFVPAVANFMLVKVGKGREIFDRLQREGVIVRPMDGYGLPEYVRVTVGTRAENERFVAALVKVLR